MISVSDIIKVLDEIPIWKAISSLPKRVAELERKVAALEGAKKANQAPGPRECPICGSEMKIERETADPTFAFAGIKVHHLKCPDCGNKANRTFEPGKGYR